MRCFVAIELPENLATALSDASSRLRDAEPAWRDAKWVRPDQLHITLKFLGELDEHSVGALLADLGPKVSAISPFTLAFERLAAVPNTRRARMLWASFVDQSGGCTALACAVEHAAVAYGVPLDERSFTPHVTLCRGRRQSAVSSESLAASGEAISPSDQSMSVGRATVLSSRLTPKGPIYSELATLRLGGA